MPGLCLNIPPASEDAQNGENCGNSPETELIGLLCSAALGQQNMIRSAQLGHGDPIPHGAAKSEFQLY